MSGVTSLNTVGLEEGMEAMEQYMRLKSVWINYGDYKGPFQK